MIIKSNNNIVYDKFKVNLIFFQNAINPSIFFPKIVWFVFKKKKRKKKEEKTYYHGLI